MLSINVRNVLEIISALIIKHAINTDAKLDPQYVRITHMETNATMVMNVPKAKHVRIVLVGVNAFRMSGQITHIETISNEVYFRNNAKQISSVLICLYSITLIPGERVFKYLILKVLLFG